MTSPTTIPTIPPSAEEVSPAAAESADGLDIKKVISGSTSNVPIAELTRKGFKHVKVLNQAMITRLITEAVDRVISRRSRSMGKEEREKIINESMGQFETLARQRLARERDRISELERANGTLLTENDGLRQRLVALEEETGRLRSGTGQEGGSPERFAAAILERLQGLGGAAGGDLSALQKSITDIAAKLDRLPGRGASDVEVVDKEALIEALFRVDSPEASDSNITKVKVKEAKAGGVKDTLAKLKALQKGGKDGD